jgi:hypothetical protein
MASVFANAIDALVAERDRAFIERICVDYNLNFDELSAKYLETAAEAIKVPRKYKKREVKMVVVTGEVVKPPAKEPKAPKEPKAKAEKQECTACTSKKEPCKFSALKGEVFCKRHLAASKASEPGAAPKVPKAKKADAPVHTHELTSEIHDDCELCQSHGNPLAEAEDFELAVPSQPPVEAEESELVEEEEVARRRSLRLASRLAALMENTEEDEYPSDSEAPVGRKIFAMGEEEFEDEE